MFTYRLRGCLGFKAGSAATRFTQENHGVTAFRLELSEKLKNHTLEAATLLVDLMNDPKTAPKLRIVCAREVLDRSIGKCMTEETALALSQQSTNRDYGSMTDAELESIVRQLPTPTHTPSKKRQSIEESMVIDGEFKET